MTPTKAGFELDSETYDRSSETHRFEYDPASTPPCMAVVSALASVLEVSPVSMEPIAETVNTDALDRLVRGFDLADGVVEASWTQAGFAVTVSSAGAVTVSPPEDEGAKPTVQR